MAIGKKTGGRNFEPGQSGNPSGSSNLAKKLGNIRKLNQAQVSEILNRFVTMSLEDVVEFANDKSNPSIEILVATILIHGIKGGDPTRLTFLLDRLIGKVKEQHEHTFLGNVNAAIVDKIKEIEKANSKGGTYAEKTTEEDVSEEE